MAKARKISGLKLCEETIEHKANVMVPFISLVVSLISLVMLFISNVYNFIYFRCGKG